MLTDAYKKALKNLKKTVKIGLDAKINLSGFSILEVLLAAGIFGIIATGALASIIYNFTANRNSEETSIAEGLAREGIEAVRSIKKAGWDSLVNGTYGISKSSGSWELAPSPDTYDKYTRTIIIEDAKRDESGNIAASGETSDPDTKKITSRVVWNLSPTRPKQIETTSYLSNWEKLIPIEGTSTGGMLAYADYSGADDTVRYKIFDKQTGEWSAEATVPYFGVPQNRNLRRLELYSSPARDEKVLLTKHSEDGQFLYMQTWNGSIWGNIIQLYGYGNDINPNTRNFDGDYLSNGDFLVVYDDFTFTPKFRIWNGLTWTAEASTHNTGGYPVWILVRNEPGTNRATAVVKDYSKDTNTMFWNGSSFSNPVEHANNASSTSLDSISFKYAFSDPAKGMLMYSQTDWQFLWITRDYKPNIRPLNNSTSWQNKIENVSIASSIETVEITARPGTNDFLGCMKDEASGISCFISRESNGYNWQNITGGPTIATGTDPGSQKSYALGFENVSGDLALIVYTNGSDGTARETPKYRTYNPSNDSLSPERSMPKLDDSLKTIRVLPDFNTDDIMVLLGDDSEDLYTIIWDGENNDFYSDAQKGLVKQAASGSSGSDFWYDFDWGHDQN